MPSSAYSAIFYALLKEAQFTNEMLGSGATQIRKASYATKGIYFQAFTSLSTGIERIGKLCLMLDYYLEHNAFPDTRYMRHEIGHRLSLIYSKSQEIIQTRQISFDYLSDLSNPIHQHILNVLSEFAEGDRYSNINLIVSGARQRDPMTSWHERVDVLIFESCINANKRQNIRQNAQLTAEAMESWSAVMHSSETGSAISSIAEASYRTGTFEAIAPYRQLYVLQVVRYWVELLVSLHNLARVSSTDIPDFGEIFAIFYNDDSNFRARKTWLLRR